WMICRKFHTKVSIALPPHFHSLAPFRGAWEDERLTLKRDRAQIPERLLRFVRGFHRLHADDDRSRRLRAEINHFAGSSWRLKLRSLRKRDRRRFYSPVGAQTLHSLHMQRTHQPGGGVHRQSEFGKLIRHVLI